METGEGSPSRLHPIYSLRRIRSPTKSRNAWNKLTAWSKWAGRIIVLTFYDYAKKLCKWMWYLATSICTALHLMHFCVCRIRKISTDSGRLQHVLQHLSLPHLQRWIPQVVSKHLLLRSAIDRASVSPAGPPSNTGPTNCPSNTYDTRPALIAQSQQLLSQRRTTNVQQVTRTI